MEIALVNGMPVVSSLRVAENFGKDHGKVLRSIRGLMAELPDEFNQANFGFVELVDAKGEKRPSCNLTRDSFALLVMGFTGKRALAWKIRYIQAFNAMEKNIQKTLECSDAQNLTNEKSINDNHRFLFRRRKSIDKEKLKGIIGWLNYWCYIDEIKIEDAKNQLCMALQVNNLQEIQEDELIYVYSFIWNSFFKIKKKTGKELTKQETLAFNGLLLFWEKCIVESNKNIMSFIHTKCNIASLDEIKEHSLRKAFNAALLGIFRHIFCNLDDRIFKI
ncbi:MAG: Rha family transcriptional regulator [Oscillospiraceae bacterium]|nr:Rha family transcriptional regulator [Oscillospiraceae bacterium]